MNYSTYRRTLDLQKHQSNLSIAVFQYDSAVRLILSFTDGGKPYLIKEGSQAVFYGKRSNDTPLCLPCTIQNESEIVFDFNDTVTAELGMVNCQIRLYGKTKENAEGEEVRELITAPRFTILVEPRVVDSDDVEIVESTLAALDQMFLDEVERTNNEKQREANELQRIANEEARQNSIEGFVSVNTKERQKLKGELEVPKLIVTDSVTCNTVNAVDVNAMRTLYSEESVKTDGEFIGASANISGKAEVGSLKSKGAVQGNSASFYNITAHNGVTIGGVTIDGATVTDHLLIGENANEDACIEVFCPVSLVGTTEVQGGLTVGGSASVDGDMSVSGNLYVSGKTTSIDHENLTVRDNIVIVNSDGTVTGKSGLVINTGEQIDSNQYVAYGILYGASGDVVYIGKGVLEYNEEDYDMSASFTFDEGQAVPLAARSGDFKTGDVAVWDADKNAFVPSGVIGDIGAALDGIISIQNNLIGGES